MDIIVPMAGFGQRFADKGYTTPKPLIVVDGKTMIEHVIGLFSPQDRFTFVCNTCDLERTALESVLRRAAPQGTIIPIMTERKGPVHGIIAAKTHLPPLRGSVIVSYCDFSMDWDYDDFKRFTNKCYDGAIITYTGFHPHHLGSTYYGYVRTDPHGRFIEIREKEPFTDNPMQEHTSAGAYYFRKGGIMLRYFDELIKRDMHKNGEFYCSLPYNLMERDGLETYIYDVPHFLQWGTPEDLEEYNAWSSFFVRKNGGFPMLEDALATFSPHFPQRTSAQLADTYDYWHGHFKTRR